MNLRLRILNKLFPGYGEVLIREDQVEDARALGYLIERHARELAECEAILVDAQRQNSKVLGPWVINQDQTSNLRAWLEGPFGDFPAGRRRATRIYQTPCGLKFKISLPDSEQKELMFVGLDLATVILAASAILRGDGWTVVE